MSTSNRVSRVTRNRLANQNDLNRNARHAPVNTSLTTTIASACLLAAVGLGMWLRRFLPEHHLSPDSRDTVKLAMGLVATMSALLLGLLVNSAKTSYDTTRSQVMEKASRFALLDRLLGIYGPRAAEVRGDLLDRVPLHTDDGCCGLMARDDFPQFQPDRTAKCHGQLRLDRLGFVRGGRHFSDSGVEWPVRRTHANLQRTYAGRVAPAWGMRTMIS
jgi:hypothetical protein